MKKLLVICLTSICWLSTSFAGTIIGGSDLVGAAELTQLEVWLGEGPLTLTNIFDKTAGDTSANFHAAVDGQGRTFSVLEILNGNGYSHQVIGGYNPQGWHTGPNYANYTPNDVDRTAFLFNFTTDIKMAQKLSGDPLAPMGEIQTYNRLNYGPTFGAAGHDLYVQPGLNGGYGDKFSYGQDHNGGANPFNIAGGTFVGDNDLIIGAIEVFAINDMNAVPEPSTYALMSLGLIGIGVYSRKRKKAK